MRCYSCRKDGNRSYVKPGPEIWLYLRKYADGEVKYFVSNAPGGLAVQELDRAATLRWPIEQCFEECKSNLGMGHYECRSYQGWKRHMLFVMIAHLFTIYIREIFKKEIALNQLFQMYMDNKTDLRKSTRCNYISVWNNGLKDSVLGNMKIAQIRQIHIRSFYSELVKKGLSANTVKLYHNLIYPALELSVDSDIIHKNPDWNRRYCNTLWNMQKIGRASCRERVFITV